MPRLRSGRAGEDFDEVYRSLNDAIALYLEHVRSLPAAEQARFLNRRAPLSQQLRFFWHALPLRFGGRRDGNGKYRAEFLVPANG